MKKRTRLINQSGGPFVVEVAISGIWQDLGTLQNNEVYKIYVDPNATYREYRCVAKNSAFGELSISTDVCLDYKSITVTLVNGAYYLKKENPRTGTGNGEAKDVKTIWDKVKKRLDFLRWK